MKTQWNVCLHHYIKGKIKSEISWRVSTTCFDIFLYSKYLTVQWVALFFTGMFASKNNSFNTVSLACHWATVATQSPSRQLNNHLKCICRSPRLGSAGILKGCYSNLRMIIYYNSLWKSMSDVFITTDVHVFLDHNGYLSLPVFQISRSFTCSGFPRAQGQSALNNRSSFNPNVKATYFYCCFILYL